jgi:nucleotide-binding universal stress UspA family protein
MGAIVPSLYDPSRPPAELKRHADRLRKSKTIVEERHFSGGSPFDRIVETAIDCKAQLVVVGAIGHGLAQRLLIGSVAERVAETSPVPTLIVRPGSKFLNWIRGERPLKILAGYDFTATGDAALRWIARLQRIGKISVTVAYAHVPTEPHREERNLMECAAGILPARQFKSILIPCWGNCEGALFERAAREKVDLVVVGTHQRRGIDRIRLGSVSRGVLRHSLRSVAIVSPPLAPESAR